MDLGELRVVPDGGRGGGSEEASACGRSPCANHRGSKTFVAPDAPPDAPERFARATRLSPGSDPEREPQITYPSHETMFPINVSRVLHEWSVGVADPLFELTFEGPRTRVSIYTQDSQFTPSEEEWDYIAESNRGSAVSFEVAVLDPEEPETALTSESITLHFSEADVEGAIYYWSTGAAGVMKALVSDPAPVKFYPDPGVSEKASCVGCHSLSRDGRRLATVLDGDRVQEISVPDRSAIVPASGAGGAPATPGGKADATDPKAGAGIPGVWTTFSPDGSLLLVAANGGLRLVDADTGEPVGPNDGVVPTPAGMVAAHPDWSALGDRVAYTLAEKGDGKSVERGSIALIRYEDGSWGSTEVIVPSSGGEDNNFYPAFSPDSRFIAYVNASGKSTDAPSAVIRLVRVEDGTILDLPRLNQRVGPLDGVSDIGNSMPTWAPSTRAGVFWLAFSSLRPYASVRAQDKKLDQLWVAAIDTAASDPSYAAFWAPFQNLDHGNHRAFWTHTSDDRQCGCVELCGDKIDNDCDGSADEADCVATCMDREICGNGVDDDCNCVVDDCAVEICDDGIDNDGDELADELDPICAAP